MKNLVIMAGFNTIYRRLVIVAYFFGPPCIYACIIYYSSTLSLHILTLDNTNINSIEYETFSVSNEYKPTLT